MLRFLLIVVLFIASGPLVAVALLAVGCTGASPLLGVACGHNAIFTLIAVAVATWRPVESASMWSFA